MIARATLPQLTTDSVGKLLVLYAVTERENLELTLHKFRHRGRAVWLASITEPGADTSLVSVRGATCGAAIVRLHERFFDRTGPRA
jgi:hypothetical protein